MGRFVEAIQRKTVVVVVRRALLPRNDEMSTNTFYFVARATSE